MSKVSKKNKKILGFIFKAFLVWRIVLIIIAWVGGKVFPFRYSFPYVEEILKKYGPNLFWVWGNFDGVHYLTIAESGYSAQFTQAFFPVYPWLIRAVSNFFGHYLFSALFISHLFFLISLFLLYKLLETDFKAGLSKRVILYLLLFPTSFFFGSVYTESLFLALILGSFLAARRGYWWLAGILGGIASGTRLIGIFLLPALLVEFWQQRFSGKQKSTLKGKEMTLIFKREFFISLAWILFVPLGLVIYMRYLAVHFGDPLYFIHAQPFFGASRSMGKVILLYQVFWRYFKMIATVARNDPLYFTVWLEFSSAVLFLVLLAWGYFHKIRASYLVFAVLAYLIPTLTGTFSSMPRYVLTLFPGFIILSLLSEKYSWLKVLYPLVSIPLLIISLMLFVQGYWVA